MLAVLRLLSTFSSNHSRILNGVRKRRVITPIFACFDQVYSGGGYSRCNCSKLPNCSSRRRKLIKIGKNPYRQKWLPTSRALCLQRNQPSCIHCSILRSKVRLLLLFFSLFCLFCSLGCLWLQSGILQSLEGAPSTSIIDISKRISSLRALVDSFGEGLPKYDRGRYASVSVIALFFSFVFDWGR